MKRLALLFLLPFASGALFAQYSITPTSAPAGTVGVQYTLNLSITPTVTAAWSVSGSLPPGLTISPPSGSSTTIGGVPTAIGTYSFTVQATVGSFIGALISTTRTYSVTISPPLLTVASASLPDGALGQPYYQDLTVAVTGGYGPGTYTFTLTGGSPPPGLGLSGSVISGTPRATGLYSFTVGVTSQTGTYAQVSASGSFTINIPLPTLTITTSSLPTGTVGATYAQTLSATGGSRPYSWQVTSGSLPGGVTLSSSGIISGTPTAAGSFTFQVTVTDSQQVSASASFTIQIAQALAITTASLPGGNVGSSYTATTLAATGGIPPYSWSVFSGANANLGALPAGLTISSAGVISGTPTTAGTFTFTLQVTDSVQSTATKGYSITVVSGLTITTASPLPDGTVGVSYSQQFSASGGVTPYTWSIASGSVPGLSLAPSSGLLSGTPTTAGSYTFTITVTDAKSQSASAPFSIRIVAALAITTQAPLPGGEVGVSYTQAFAATGGTLPYQWSVSAGTAPTGLTLNATSDTTGASLAGTPTAGGTFSFTIQVKDSAGRTATQAFTITVAAGVKLTTAPPLPDGTVGVSYSQQFSASGGVTPYTWSIASGSIPSGLSLSTTTGLLSGSPTTAGTYAFTIAVTDQNRQTNSAAFSIRIAAALTITTQYPIPGAADGMVGVPFTLTFAATGGTSPYQWSVSSGALPTGLTLSASGSLTGSPTATGTFNFTVQVTDSASPARTATQAYTIVVVQLSITTASPLPNATVGTAYSQTLAVTGSGEPYLVTYAWSISAGALPGGITLDASAGSLTGTPSAPGTFTFTVSVTGGGQTATKSFTITVGVPPGPSATITGLPATASPATQPALGISIPSAYPLAITGQVTLTFAPDSPSPDGQEVVFTTGGRTLSFTVAANTTQAVFTGATPGVQTGTVSGTITLTLKLTAAGIDITPSPAPSTKLTIAKAAPVIKSSTVTRTSSGFNLVVVGYATSREMVSAAVTFTPAAGVTLSSTSATVSLSSIFTTWYADPTSAQYGSNFSLTMPFTFTNATSTAPLTSVSVVLTNLQGSSTSASATY